MPEKPRHDDRSEHADKRRPRLSQDEYSRVASRNAQRRAARPLLDPYGIYGTRTVARRRAARRRRMVQNLSVLMFLVLMGIGAYAWVKTPRVLRFSPDTSLKLAALPSQTPVLTRSENAQILVPTETGWLISIESHTQQKSRLPISDFALSSPPLINSGRVFVGSTDGSLHRFDSHIQKNVWRFGFEHTVVARPLLWKNGNLETVIASSDAGEVVALNAATGQKIWRTDLEAPVGQGIALASTRNAQNQNIVRVYLPLGGNWRSRGGMACLDAKNGRILWRADLLAAHLSTPAIETTIDGKIWVYSAGDDGAVFRLDGATGKRDGGGWKTFVAAQTEQWSLWSNMIPTREPVAAVLRGEPLLKEYSWGTRLVLGGEDGALRCFDAENGRLLWTFDAGASLQSRPATLRLSQGKVEHDFLLVAGSDRCYAIDARSGQRIWEWQTGEALRGSPLVDANAAFMVTQSGRVLRFALPTLSDIAAML